MIAFIIKDLWKNRTIFSKNISYGHKYLDWYTVETFGNNCEC